MLEYIKIGRLNKKLLEEVNVKVNDKVMILEKALKDGYRTKDIAQNGMEIVGTDKMGNIIKDNILQD